MFPPPEPHLPYSLMNLSSDARDRIKGLRSRYAIGLLHSDDMPSGIPLRLQMETLQYRAIGVLGPAKAPQERGRNG